MIKKIHDIIKEYKDIKYLAYHDVMTGLYNRAYLLRKVNVLNYRVLYFIDLNGLKAINNTLTHADGDIFIQSCVDEIKKKIWATDLFIRYGGDEFIVLSTAMSLLESTERYAVGKQEIMSIFDTALDGNILQAEKDMRKHKVKTDIRII